MKEIQLTQGKVALVDDEDFERVNQFKWSARKSKNGNVWYAMRGVGDGSIKKTIYLHAYIMGDNPHRAKIDHRDNNGLNDQKYNLRFCTNQQNIMNSKPHLNSVSIYKGVYWRKDKERWVARIWLCGIRIHCKHFVSEIEAAKQYDIWATELFGKFAYLNFPENKPENIS